MEEEVMLSKGDEYVSHQSLNEIKSLDD